MDQTRRFCHPPTGGALKAPPIFRLPGKVSQIMETVISDLKCSLKWTGDRVAECREVVALHSTRLVAAQSELEQTLRRVAELQRAIDILEAAYENKERAAADNDAA